MNEEEKEAIKVLNNFNPTDCGIEDTQAIETILNLIEKQQKEIEKRLKEIDALYKMMSVKDERIEDLKENNGYHLGFIDGGISKRYEMEDKIKAKVEELDNQQRQWREDRTNKHTDAQIIYARDVLEELLGE